MNDEKLILLVEAADCIYNRCGPNYKFAEKKKAAWKRIAEEMNSTEYLCMKRWACLRDRYAREKWLEKLPSGANSEPSWSLMSMMEFVDRHVVPRPMRSSVNITEEYSNTSVDIPPQSECIEVFSEAYSLSSQSLCLSSPSSVVTKRKRKDTSDDAFSEAVGVFKRLCETKEEGEKEKQADPNYGFGKMMAATIATMSSAKQMKAMQKLPALLWEIKLESE